MRSVALVLVATMLGCGGGAVDPAGPGSADYTLPTWAIMVDRSQAHGPGGEPMPTPTDEQIAVEFDRVTAAWANYWNEQSNGTWRGIVPPPEELYAEVGIDHVYSTSCDDTRGEWGVQVRGWSYTDDGPRPVGEILEAICHGISHQVSGTAGDTAHYARFARVAGC